MVKKELYLDYCIMALIPITRSEMKIIDGLTNGNGWFDEHKYLSLMDASRMCVTWNQKRILSFMPKRYSHKSKKKLEAMGTLLGEIVRSNRRSF